MNVTVTVRHAEVSDDVRIRAASQVEKLQKFDDRLSRAEVIFDEEGKDTTVEAILYIDRDDPVAAGAEHPDALIAVDRMIDKLSKILRRRRSQLRSNRHARRTVPEPDVESA